MPVLAEDKIKEKIADGSISAISIDTAVFDKYGCNLDFPVLHKLNQFKAGPISVLLSEIIISEVKGHIVRDALESQRHLNKALRQHSKRWKANLDFEALPNELALSADPEGAADAQLRDYLAAVGGEIVPIDGVNNLSGELLRRYFASEPPFESGDKKKHEFPDAFALLSLEGLAKKKQQLILCVSPDKGWKNFADASEHLVCVADLELALSYFNDSGRNIADQTIAMWKAGTAPELAEEVERAFEYRLDDADFLAIGSSPMEYDGEPISAIMQSVNLDTATAPVVIASDDESVTFTTELSAVVAFEAGFSFYVMDGIDRDYVSLGSACYSIEDEVTFQIVITVLRGIDLEPKVVEVEIAQRYIEVDFGFIEPFPDEDPTHEKY